MYRLLQTLPLFVLLAAALTADVASAQQQLVNVTFSNQTDRPAQVLWVNGGQLQKYLDLQPGESQSLQSYVGHAWRIVGAEASKGRMITRANEVIILGDFAQPAPPVEQFPRTFEGPFQPRQPQPRQPQPRQPQVQQPQVQPQPTASVNQRIADFARSVVGQRIGNGQCTELAIAALRAAGARPNQMYVWGSALRGPEALQPGDIIQMYDARFVYANRESWSTGPHTAVVVAVEGTLIHVLEQNINGSPVQQGSYDIQAMTAGRMEYYRPVAGGNSNNNFAGRPWRN